MFTRQISVLLKSQSSLFKIFALMGPRQSGKTTLLRTIFTDYKYVSLESPDVLERLNSDVRGFFKDTKTNWIIDEAQKSPSLFSYLQEFVDDPIRKNKFILSGSQNFLLHENISQSLAGRIGLYELLPLSYSEYITYPNITPLSLWEFLFCGQYPRPYHEKLPIKKWIESYIQTYIERDVRQIENIKDLAKFKLFIKLCAGYHGQQFNAHQVSVDCGISQTTVHNWLSILESSFLIFKLQPYYKNYNKRLVKTPKIYFYDSGIVCQLLGIDSTEHLEIHPQRGAIFEGFILTEIIKNSKNKDKYKQLYYWRTHQGQEIDVIIDSQPKKILEIKSGMTFQKSFVDTILNWQLMSDEDAKGFLIYAGDEDFEFKNIDVLSWKDTQSLI